MTKLINFIQDQEEFCCPTCELVSKYVEIAKQAESEEDLFDILSNLIDESRLIDIKQKLIHEIHYKMDLLEKLECDCDECHCEV
ncbi:hypothetical protein [Heyndrickxia camelliae]|uniref:hypothetical protein n=1 Tax=Heyndrickxia camelliae TaxID=1707093 RepID=UPI001055CD47|nr:hypothetical protein [Heyndrickxia camelliae]